eukprot:48758-Eustigmatos_ZCMA.PRE.1
MLATFCFIRIESLCVVADDRGAAASGGRSVCVGLSRAPAVLLVWDQGREGRVQEAQGTRA